MTWGAAEARAEKDSRATRKEAPLGYGPPLVLNLSRLLV